MKVYCKVFDALCERYLNLGATNRIGYRDKVYKIQQIYDKGYVVCYAPEEVLYTWGMTDKEIKLMQEVEFAWGGIVNDQPSKIAAITCKATG